MLHQNPLTTAKANKLVRRVFGHNSPAAAAREVFKPSTDSASLVLPSQKKFSVLAWGFSWGDVTSGLSRATVAASGRLMHFLILGVK